MSFQARRHVVKSGPAKVRASAKGRSEGGAGGSGDLPGENF